MEHIIEKVKPYGMLTAGALFGAGWWAWCDVILRNALVHHTTVGAAYYVPGIVATIAVILMACIQRDDADGYIGYDSEGETCRTKCGLFVAYCASFGSIAAAVVILLMIRQEGGDLNIGVDCVAARIQLQMEFDRAERQVIMYVLNVFLLLILQPLLCRELYVRRPSSV